MYGKVQLNVTCNVKSKNKTLAMMEAVLNSSRPLKSIILHTELLCCCELETLHNINLSDVISLTNNGKVTVF